VSVLNNIYITHGTGVRVGDSDIAFSVQLKSLGVTLDQNLSFDQHISNIVKSSNYNIRALRHIRPMLDKTVANTVACSIVSTRLDYCNSLLYGTSVRNVQRLQRIQNSLARVVSGTRRRDHIRPVLKDLHWLPVTQRIDYKIALITRKVLSNGQPSYLHSSSTNTDQHAHSDLKDNDCSRDRVDSSQLWRVDHSHEHQKVYGTSYMTAFERSTTSIASKRI
jgi:hypothetical protein